MRNQNYGTLEGTADSPKQAMTPVDNTEQETIKE